MSWRVPDVYVDGLMTTAKRVGLPELSCPIPRNNNPFLLSEEWQMQITDTTSWVPVPLNTPHPEATGFILVDESERKDVGVSSVKWTRRYAKVPPSYDQPTTAGYNFIGYFGPYGGQLQPTDGAPQGRNRQLLSVACRIKNDFFLVDTNTGTPGGPVYDNPLHIPVISAQKYRLSGILGSSWWMDIDFLSSNPPYNFATTPSRTTYEGYCQNAAVSGWDSGIVNYKWNIKGGQPTFTDLSDPNAGQICIEDSQLDQWQGNIWLRRTKLVLAQ